jgi:hypothetical protein
MEFVAGKNPGVVIGTENEEISLVLVENSNFELTEMIFLCKLLSLWGL